MYIECALGLIKARSTNVPTHTSIPAPERLLPWRFSYKALAPRPSPCQSTSHRETEHVGGTAALNLTSLPQGEAIYFNQQHSLGFHPPHHSSRR